ncbi:MAG: methyltransferase [Planctomycetes bacterium]|nr:methyltransferase [Planctomycetota bacterium]
MDDKPDASPSGATRLDTPDQPTTLYDLIPYVSRPYARAHVGRLATIATLMGLTPPPIARCRALELGCAAGGHLIPMALTLPESQFLGIDISAREIADGQSTIAALGLKNIRLQHLSIEDAGDAWGHFDYIIAHGVYSWVPPHVREKILDIFARNLAPNGVAFISYNTFPGWHLRRLARDAILYGGRGQDDPLARARQGRAFLEFLAKASPKQHNPYAEALKKELETVRRVADWYLCHDHLADTNEPVYFFQFAEQIAAKGLQYLGEAEFAMMLPRGLPQETLAALREVPSDLIAQQQALDFIRATPFRQSLLCHGSVALDHRPEPKRLETLSVAAQANADPAQFDLNSPTPVTFRGPGGTLATNRPLMKAAMLHLMEAWPQAVPFPALCAAARARLAGSPIQTAAEAEEDARSLASIILKGYYASNLLELHARPFPLRGEPGERPAASPLARLQAASSAVVTNLRHESIQLSELNRCVLKLLDGARPRAALLDALAALVQQGVLVLQQGARGPVDAARRLLSESLDSALRDLARSALLTA